MDRGYDYQDAELATARARLTDKAHAGDSKAQGDLTKVKKRQRSLEARKQAALAVLRREPELIASGEVTFLAHALVVPLTDPEDRKRHDAEVEALAVKVAWAFEEAAGACVQDVSTPPLAVRAGLIEHPGFDLLSERPGKGRRAIEVKGRGGNRRRGADGERVGEGVQPPRPLLAVRRFRLRQPEPPIGPRAGPVR